MLTDPRDLPAFLVPEAIYTCRVKDIYDLRLLPGGRRMKNGERRSGFRAELSWHSSRIACRRSVEVEFSVDCLQGDVWIRQTYHPDLVFEPYPQGYHDLNESCAAWRDADVDALVQSLKLEICRFELLVIVDKWRWALTAHHLPRQQELIEDMAMFVDQAMTSLMTQFPDVEHVFPIPLREPMAGLAMR
jgi:hypothetical protein